jgi:hypothetical protein
MAGPKSKEVEMGTEMKLGYAEHKILIWGKTYPELSKKYIETVCTAGA